MLSAPLVENDGVVGDKAIKLDWGASVLGYRAGDPISLRREGFVRRTAALFQERQEKFAEWPALRRTDRPAEPRRDSGAGRGKTGQGSHDPPFSRSALHQDRLQERAALGRGRTRRRVVVAEEGARLVHVGRAHGVQRRVPPSSSSARCSARRACPQRGSRATDRQEPAWRCTSRRRPSTSPPCPGAPARPGPRDRCRRRDGSPAPAGTGQGRRSRAGPSR